MDSTWKAEGGRRKAEVGGQRSEIGTRREAENAVPTTASGSRLSTLDSRLFLNSQLFTLIPHLRMGVALPAIVGLATLLNGCGDNKSPAKTDGVKTKTVPVAEQKTTPKQPDEKKPAKPAVKLKPYDPPQTVELKDVTPKELQEFIATQKGRVVLVDYWFVDCPPCRKAFPHTLELARKHARDGLVVVSMCVDTLGNRDRGLSFLTKSNARVVNFYASEKLDPETLPDEFAVPSFPMYRLYGPDGKQFQSLTSTSLDPEDLRKKVDAAVLSALGRS